MASAVRRIFSQSLSVPARQRQSYIARSSVSYLIKSLGRHCSSAAEIKGKTKPKPQTVSINFVDRDGDLTTVKAKVGDSLLDIAKDNDIDLEGACEGTLSCSTCHLIFKPEEMEKLGLDEPTDEELDMLDLAYGLTDTSRLGCQIDVTKSFEGITLTVPKAHRDIRNL